MAVTSPGTVTSALIAMASPPAATMAATTSSARGALARWLMTTGTRVWPGPMRLPHRFPAGSRDQGHSYHRPYLLSGLASALSRLCVRRRGSRSRRSEKPLARVHNSDAHCQRTRRPQNEAAVTFSSSRLRGSAGVVLDDECVDCPACDPGRKSSVAVQPPRFSIRVRPEQAGSTDSGCLNFSAVSSVV